MKYKCKLCPYETDNYHGYAGHMGGHKKRGELQPKAEVPVPLKPEDIANALLKRVVETLTSYDTLLEEVKELKGYKKEFFKLEKEFKLEKQEKERILKLHNSQARGKEEYTDADTLMRLAKLHPEEGGK